MARRAREGASLCLASPFPCLFYRDVPAAIDFLCRGFGRERHAVHADAEAGGVTGRSYNCRDPGGNDWDFETYDLWA